MKRINSSYKLVEFLSGRRSGADTVVNVVTIEFRFRAIVLIEKFVLDVAYVILKNFKYFKMIPMLVEIFRNLH